MEQCLAYYNEQISFVETQLASRLRDQLGGAKSADEMFSIYSADQKMLMRCFPFFRNTIPCLFDHDSISNSRISNNTDYSSEVGH